MERLDAIRMVKLYIPYEIGSAYLIPPVQEVFDIIAPGFLAKRIGIQIDDFARSVSVFKGLIDSQLRSISSICRIVHVKQGDLIFEEGSTDRQLYMLLRGEAEILSGADQTVVGRVLAGDVLGEISLVDDAPHSATARAARDCQFIVLAHEDFRSLTKRYPRIGMTVLQNIARSLGNKLKSVDILVAELGRNERSQR
jgi:CRP-like cAMP-binding protein